MSDSTSPDTDTGAALDFNIVDPDNAVDEVLFPKMARLRRQAPVYWSKIQKAWIVTSHEGVLAGLADERFSAQRQLNQFRSIPEEERPNVIPNLIRFTPNWITNVDGEQHRRLRRLTTKAFSRKVVDNLRTQVETLSNMVLDGVSDGSEIDFVTDVAFRIPATVIVQLLGLPERYVPELRRWAGGITALSVSPPREDVIRAENILAEMNEALAETFREKRKKPGIDLISELIAARDGDDLLSEEELLGLCHVLIIAGHNTTAHSISKGLMAFLRNPDQRDYFMANPDKGLDCMTELLRHGGMSNAMVRMARQDMEFGGQPIKSGDFVIFMLAAANRDPAIFDDPDRLDCTRRNNHQAMTFGPGFHHCLGHILARMELEVFFRVLFSRFTSIEILDKKVRFTPTAAFRGPESLRVRLSA